MALQIDEEKQKIKCVVWDLDNTIWDGVLLEDENVSLKDDVLEIIKALDERGILQSIASKNDYSIAMDKLKNFCIEEYFLYPQINWDAKSHSIANIAKSINISIDSIAFIDDQPYERDEVKSVLPKVLCIDAKDIVHILELPQMMPRFITEDSKKRRIMYKKDIERKIAEENFVGPQEEFLASLKMLLTFSPVTEKDLKRAEELTVRTHQLNTTGYTYSFEELDEFRKSDKHKIIIADLEDRFGTYGKIGLVLIECEEKAWTIKLMLMSCRVMSRGIGSILLNYVMNLAKKSNVLLKAEFISTSVNRMMYITYSFAGFKEVETQGNRILLENNLGHIQPFPQYIHIESY